MNRVPRSPVAIASVLALSAAVLVGCSGDEDPEPAAAPTARGTTAASGSPSPSDSSSETAYLPVPDGVELTPQGSALDIGDEAVVAYQPRQELLGVLGITVDRIDRTTFAKSFAGWKLDAATRSMTPYFVQVSVTNNGETDLGRRQVPLYVVDSSETLLESSTFRGTFEPCPSRAFPRVFGTGRTMSTCLVYLIPDGARLEAVSFRPTQDFTAITWTGELTAPRTIKPGRPGKPGKPAKGGQPVG